MSFREKVILITGASSGIGAAAAIHLSKLGASLAIVGRDSAKLSATAQQIIAESTNAAVPLEIVADVTTDAERIIRVTVQHFGKLDVLVNNAGICETGTWESTSVEAFDRVMSTNVKSVFHLSKLAAPHLIQTRGCIVNVSSLMGLRAFTNLLAYCTSKSAVNQLTQCMALELAPFGVRVNAVNPGAVRTPIFRTIGLDDTAMAQYEEQAKQCYPLGRIGFVEDTSSAIEFLANDASSAFITGLLLSVDGGIRLGCPRVLN